MSQPSLYPLQFEPVCQYRLWGGQRLAEWLPVPLPDDEPIGEAWLLSDREDCSSVVAQGPLQGRTIGELMKEFPEPLLGKLFAHVGRFPLLLKFLDARETLSVQVHPSDRHATFLPPGERGKTEAWVILDAEPESRIYAGLSSPLTAKELRGIVASGSLPDYLAHFEPEPGDAILLPAGVIHALGGAVIFEVQQNSDVTFRLYDWGRIDPATGRRRTLQVDQAIACLDYAQGPVGPVVPEVESTEPVRRERLFQCEFFGTWRLTGEKPFPVGVAGQPRILVFLEGEGQLVDRGVDYAFAKGSVILLPAEVGECLCKPSGEITMLEISLPEIA